MDVLNTAINDDKSNEVRCANLRLNRIEFLKQLERNTPMNTMLQNWTRLLNMLMV